VGQWWGRGKTANHDEEERGWGCSKSNPGGRQKGVWTGGQDITQKKEQKSHLKKQKKFTKLIGRRLRRGAKQKHGERNIHVRGVALQCDWGWLKGG